MKIAAYLIGSFLVIGGIIYGAMALGAPPIWLGVIGLIGAGIAITSTAGKVVSSKKVESTAGDTTTETETVVQ